MRNKFPHLIWVDLLGSPPEWRSRAGNQRPSQFTSCYCNRSSLNFVDPVGIPAWMTQSGREPMTFSIHIVLL